MILAKFFRETVTLRVSNDFAGRKVFMVIYGLQVKTFHVFREAFDEFNTCCLHCAQCEGFMDE